MTDFDLLTSVQPTDGWFAILGIKGKSVRQELVESREEADALVQAFVDQERDVYFGVAKFASGDSRQKHNVKALKSFWLDIDCGEAKAEPDPKTGIPDGYATQAIGLQELKRFCDLVGLPKPTLVNSGRGLHVYWALDREVSRDEWEPVAARLRELCVTHKLYVDPAVFEVARVLRVPNTLNFKDAPPKPVAVMVAADAVDFDEFKDLLGVEELPVAEAPPKREMTALGQSFVDSSVNKFSKIMLRSAKGNGCAQLLSCYQDRAELTEPRWFNALSIAKFCVDSASAIQKISEGHPDYDPVVVERKINHILGPHTCEEFEKFNPGGCEGCPFKGTIKSPIVLGREVEQATEEDNVVVEYGDEGEQEVHHIPDFPFPFFRGKGGGVWYQPDEEESEPQQVYEHDLYVLKRMKDPVLGDVVVIKLHLPFDGVQEFVVPNTQLTEKSDIRKVLAKHGVLCGTAKKFDLLVWFVTASIRELQSKRKAEQMRLQFGWADNDSKFIVGDREISPDGVFHSPASPSTQNFVDNMQKEGTFDKWKEVFDMYGKEGLEGHAFAALTAFGSPLLKFTGQQGAIINVIHQSSGTGKTTILHMCNSVWGHPEKLAGMWDDTINAKFVRLGILNNLPCTIDEITNTEPKEFSQLAYGMSQGRAKERMIANKNELRKNLSTWRSISLASSNASFYEKLTSMKNSPDGEMMRLIEYKIDYSDAIDATTAKYMFDHQLKSNYGHAGDIFAEYLVRNMEEVRDAVLSIQQKVDKEFKLTQRERFWSAVMAANLTGGLIARKLGLLSWDIQRIYKFCGNLINDLREEVHTPADSVVAVLGDYINRHIQNILVVNDAVDLRSNMPTLPLMEPRGDLLIRYEPDTKMMYVAAKPFKNDCVLTQVNYKATLKELDNRGIYAGTMNKRLSKGMKVTSPGVHCLIFDCSSSEFLDVDGLLHIEETEDAGGEG